MVSIRSVIQAGPDSSRPAGSNSSRGGAASESGAEFFRIGSPPPSAVAARSALSVGGTGGSGSSQVLCVAVASDARVIATVTRSGKLSLNHTDSGIAVSLNSHSFVCLP